MKKYILLAGLAAMLSPGAAIASENDDEEIVTVVVGDKGVTDEVITELTDNAPQHRRESGLPRFAIVGHDNKFYMGIGAQLNGMASFDFGDQMPSSYNFIPSSMTRKVAGDGANLRFSAATSNIYLNVVALPGTENRIGLFFKGDFTNNNYGFNISHFYATWRGLTAGYTNSLFEDAAAMPFTIDNQGPNGSAAQTVMRGSWTQKFTPHFSGAIGIEGNTADMTVNGYTRQVTQRLPAIPLYLQYGWGGSSHLRASFIFRPMQYRNLEIAENKTPLGWGVQLSGLAELAPFATFYYSATYGRGIADYLQDDNGLGLDATPDLAKPGSLELTKSMGLTGGLGFQLSKKWESNLTYSHLTNWTNASARPADSTYRYGDYVAANLIYDLNRFLTFGLEYDYGHAKDWSGNSLHSNRLMGLLQVTF